MEFNKFKELLLQKAKQEGFSESEVYYTKGESISISVYEEEIDKYINNCISVRKIEKCEICGKNQITTELSFFEDKQSKMREIILKILQKGLE